MHIFHASWIVPVCQPPIRDGWIAFDHGRIVALGEQRAALSNAVIATATHDDCIETDLGSVAIMPALVNAHTHLELSWMRGAVTHADRFSDWIRFVIGCRRNPPGAEAVGLAISNAIDECRRTGTALLGDVGNEWRTVEPLAASPLHAVIFHELIGFENGRAAALVAQAMQRRSAQPTRPNVRVTLSAHAPYSVSPSLFRGIRAALSAEPSVPSSVHLGESIEELEFLQTGGGPWRALLEELGVWDPSWIAPSCDPAEYLDRIGFLDERVLCVHGVHLTETALARLARRGAILVTCPRGNRLTRAGSPPIGAFYAAGLRVAVGTDSLASVPDLNLFSELNEMRRLAPDVPARLLLESATSQGARALGWDTEFGTIEPGRRATLLAVAVPDSAADVEEYLVNGIQADQITWVGQG